MERKAARLFALIGMGWDVVDVEKSTNLCEEEMRWPAVLLDDLGTDLLHLTQQRSCIGCQPLWYDDWKWMNESLWVIANIGVVEHLTSGIVLQQRKVEEHFHAYHPNPWNLTDRLEYVNPTKSMMLSCLVDVNAVW